jgi:ubiquinone/menaquinone biosynthesis C-methylase UbiE
MLKSKVSKFLRDINLLYVTDKVRFYVERFKNQKENNAFKKKHPNVVLPPDYLVYESFGMNYNNYFTNGIVSAKWMVEHFKNYTTLKDKKILDWGCGPGRIIRHLPEVVGNGCEYYGTDYNSKTIDWCSKNIEGINFNNNTLEAKLPYPDDYFDLLYGISIFTHLSEKMHYDWYAELHRVLKKDGFMFLTTQGENFIPKLTAKELDTYNANNLVVRGNVKEGHRTYSAFQPKGFMQNLFSNAIIADHIETKQESNEWRPQDIWVVKKK